MQPQEEERKQTGSGLSARAAIIVAVIAAVGGWGTAAITNWDKIFGSTSSGSPFVYWRIIPAKVNLSQCGNIALETLQVAGPKKLEAADEEDGAQTRVADFGELTGWVSCIEARQSTTIYVGVSGNDFSDAKNKSEQLVQLISTRLSPPRK
jgi:hypothetical protein